MLTELTGLLERARPHQKAEHVLLGLGLQTRRLCGIPVVWDSHRRWYPCTDIERGSHLLGRSPRCVQSARAGRPGKAGAPLPGLSATCTSATCPTTFWRCCPPSSNFSFVLTVRVCFLLFMAEVVGACMLGSGVYAAPAFASWSPRALLRQHMWIRSGWLHKCVSWQRASYGTWLLFQRLDDASKDSDIPKNVPFAFAINNRNTSWQRASWMAAQTKVQRRSLKRLQMP